MRDMIQHIRKAKLPQEFTAAKVIEELSKDNKYNEPIYYVSTYLWKHSDKNKRPGSGHKYFIWKSIGLYSLK